MTQPARKLMDQESNTPRLEEIAKIHRNLSAPALYEAIIRRGEAEIADLGPIIANTGKYTGRSPNDKFIVKEPTSEKNIGWGKVNRAFEADKFEQLYQKMMAYAQGKELFVQDCYAGADPDHRLPIRVVNEFAWQNLFARNMFVRITDPKELENHQPEFTVICFPNVKADPKVDGTNSEAFVLANFERRLILIGGTHYAGETKKSVFSVLNYLLPLKSILSMHCSANIGAKGDVAIFFGLSGTGKTTLSADPERCLIGDDEHGWSDNGVFNFEGGCYAKVIRLSEKAEPEIYACTKRFGTILENVVIDPVSRKVNLDDDQFTENTRASYPLDFIPNFVPEGRGGHAENIIMLTCDAFGVLPPVAKLTPEQAMYHFLSGYTAKVAGTERGIKEPQATFSSCFGEPFMSLKPAVYAKLLGEKISKHKAQCWLINTGWSGGPYGIGSRMAIADSRAIITAALDGSLKNIPTRKDPIFGLEVPESCPGISSPDVLNPKNTWKDKKAYDAKAKDLATRFHTNFKSYEADVSDVVRAAGPVVA